MLLTSVLVGVAALFLIAFIWSRLLTKPHHYPAQWLQRSPPQRLNGVWLDE